MRFIKGMIWGLIVATVTAMVSMPRMDKRTMKKIRKGSRGVSNYAGDMFGMMNKMHRKIMR